MQSFAKSKLNVILTGGLVLVGVNFAGTAAFNAYYQHQVKHLLSVAILVSLASVQIVWPHSL